MIWQNEVFGDDIHLIGLWQAKLHRRCIVTTHPGLQGERTTLEALADAFVAAGFNLLSCRVVSDMKVPSLCAWKVSISGTCIPLMSSSRLKASPSPSTSLSRGSQE